MEIWERIEEIVRNNDIREVKTWTQKKYPHLPIGYPVNYYVTFKIYEVNGERRRYEFSERGIVRFHSFTFKGGWYPERQWDDEIDGVILGTLEEELMKEAHREWFRGIIEGKGGEKNGVQS